MEKDVEQHGETWSNMERKIDSKYIMCIHSVAGCPYTNIIK